MNNLFIFIVAVFLTLSVHASNALLVPKDNFLDRYDLADVSHEKLMLDNWNAHIEQFAGIRCNDLQEMYNYHFADHKEFVRLLDAKNTAVILLNHAAFKLYFEISLLLQHLRHSSAMIIHDGKMEKTLNRAEIADLKSAIEDKKFDILSNKYLAIRDNVDKLLIPIVQVVALFLAIQGDYDLLLWYIDNANTRDDEMYAGEGSHDRFFHRLCISCQINPTILSKVKNKNFLRFAKNPQNRLGFLPIEYAIAAKDFTLIQMLKNIGCEPYYVDGFEYLFIRMVVACNYSLSSLKEVLKRMRLDINKPTINRETQMDIAKKYNDQTYIQALSYLNDSIDLIDEKNWDSKFALQRE